MKGPPSNRTLNLQLLLLFYNLSFEPLRQGPSKVLDFVEVSDKLRLARGVDERVKLACLCHIVIEPPEADDEPNWRRHYKPGGPFAERPAEVPKEREI